jgi:hypothetical protein
LDKEYIKNLNRTIMNSEIEAVIKSLLTKKRPGPAVFTAELYQTFKEEPTPMGLKLSYEIKREGALSNRFYEASINHYTKTR